MDTFSIDCSGGASVAVDSVFRYRAELPAGIVRRLRLQAQRECPRKSVPETKNQFWHTEKTPFSMKMVFLGFVPAYSSNYERITNSFVNFVKTSTPSEVTTTSSSIRTPVTSALYTPGSIVKTMPSLSSNSLAPVTEGNS